MDIFNQYNLIYFKGTRRFNVNNNGGGYSQNYYENQVNNNGNGYQQSYREHKREANKLLNSNSVLIIHSKNILVFKLIDRSKVKKFDLKKIYNLITLI